jgi:hypothetical protein
MPSLFRALLKKNRWFWEEPLPWLLPGEIPADPLEHLIPNQFRLSVFEVDGDRTRIERVAAAIAAKRYGEIDTVEFIVFDQSVLEELGIQVDNAVPGDTCDAEVNLWHRDIVNISAGKLVEFATRIVPTVRSDWVLSKRIREVILESIRAGRYEWSRVNLKRKAVLQQEAQQ